MSPRPAETVRRFGDPCLRRVCRPAEPASPATADLLDRIKAEAVTKREIVSESSN